MAEGEGRGASLAILAKAPVPGYAKTRLVPRLGAEGSAELHALLVERTLRTALASGLAPVVLWCAPDRRAPFFAAVAARHGVELRDQPEGDLGRRILAALEAHLAGGTPALVAGTDCPGLAPGHLGRMRAALAAGADAVLLPAEDGGYAALGLARLAPSLFEDVPWGTRGVLAATRARLGALGWRARELPPLRDVDVPADLDWLLASGLLDAEERARIARHVR
jgi:hypothetical protein